MKRLSNIMIILVLGCVILVGCKRDNSAKIEPQFITKEGQFPIDADAGVEVFRDDNGLLNIRHYVDGGSCEWTKGVIDPNSDWFVYVEQRNEAWMVYGDTVDFVYHHEAESGTKGLFGCCETAHLDERLYSQMPNSVRERLPTEVTQRIKRQNKAEMATPNTPTD